MGMRDMIEEWVSSLLAVGIVKASSIAGGTEPIFRIIGDMDPDGNEEMDQIEQFTTAPLCYRPKPAAFDAEGMPIEGMEVVFIRWDDERLIIGTKDRRWEVAPDEGEVIVLALGKDGARQALHRLKPDGNQVLEGIDCTLDFDGDITIGNASTGAQLVKGGSVTVESSDVKLGSSSASDAVALASKVEAELTSIKTTLDSISGATFGTPYDWPGVPPRSVGAGKVTAE